jgi:hypothetical protein
MKGIVGVLIGLAVSLSLCAAVGAGELNYTPRPGVRMTAMTSVPQLTSPSPFIRVGDCSIVCENGTRASRSCASVESCFCHCLRNGNAWCSECK